MMVYLYLTEQYRNQRKTNLNHFTNHITRREKKSVNFVNDKCGLDIKKTKNNNNFKDLSNSKDFQTIS